MRTNTGERGRGQPDFDAIVEAMLYLYTESRRITKGLAGRYGLTGPQLAVIKMLEPSASVARELRFDSRAQQQRHRHHDRRARGLVVRRRGPRSRVITSS